MSSGRYSNALAPGDGTTSRRRLLPLLAVGAALLALLLGGTASSYSPAPESTWVVSGGIPAAGANVNSVAVNGNTAYLGGDFAFIGPETGSFVAADTAAGTLASPWPIVGGNVYAVASDGANGFYIGGFFNSIGTKHADNIAHIKSDGTLDTSWTGSTNGTVYAIAVSDDTVFAGGAFSTAGGAPKVNLAAFNKVSGAVVPNFTANATGGTNPFVAALRLSPPGPLQKLYVGGRFLSLAESTRSNLGAVFTSGGIDGFAPPVNNVVYALAESSDGATVYAGGAFTAVTIPNSNLARNFAAAFSSAGAPQAWDPEANGQVYALDVSGTTVYAGGGFSVIGGAPRRGLAALNAGSSGQAKTNWNPDVNGQVFAISAPGAGTTVYVGGRFDTVNLTTGRDNLAAIDSSTGTVTTFAPVVGGEVDALAVSGTNVGLGGEFRSTGTGANQPRHRGNLAAIDLTTGQPTSWNPIANNTVQVVAVSGGRVYAGGDFTAVGAAANTVRHRLAAFDLINGTALPWDPGVHNGSVYALAFSGSTVYVGGSFSGATAVSNPPVAKNRVAAFEASNSGNGLGNLRTLWDPNADSDVYALDVVGSTLYVGGLFTHLRNTVVRNHLAAVPADTSVGFANPLPWNPNVSGTVFTLAHAGSLEYAGGPFTAVNGGTLRGGAAAFDQSTGTATAWNPQVLRDATTAGTVFSLVPSGPYMYLSGIFRSVGGPWSGPGSTCTAPCFSSPAVAAVSLATAAPNTSWQPGADDLISSIAMSPQGLVMGGQFTTLGFPPPGTLPVNADEPGATYRGGFALVHALPESPTNVTATPADGSATVTFGAPAFTGGAPVDSYTLTVNPGNIVMNAVTTGVNVPNLTNGTAYTFSVTATTSAGVGEPGVASATPRTIPDAPTGVTAAPDDGRAVVSFTAPFDGGAPITLYTVTASTGQTATGTETSITIYGLANDAPVTFTVKATNVAGQGPASDPSAPVTPVEGGRPHPTPPTASPRPLTPDPPASVPRPPVPAH